MIKTTIVDNDGQELEAFANTDNKLFISITQTDVLNMFCIALEYDDALVFQKMVNTAVKSIKQDL